MIKEKVVEIFGATGSPGGNSIPLYASKKAPNGDWLMSEKSSPINPVQKTLRNGTPMVMVDPDKVPTVQEKASGTPLWDCVDGVRFFNSNGYCRVWLYSPEPDSAGGHGVDVVSGYEAWMETSHLRPPVETPVPEPQPEPEPETEPEPTPLPAEEYSVRLVSISWDGGPVLKFRKI